MHFSDWRGKYCGLCMAYKTYIIFIMLFYVLYSLRVCKLLCYMFYYFDLSCSALWYVCVHVVRHCFIFFYCQWRNLWMQLLWFNLFIALLFCLCNMFMFMVARWLGAWLERCWWFCSMCGIRVLYVCVLSILLVLLLCFIFYVVVNAIVF
jgi:hypothetical protein